VNSSQLRGAAALPAHGWNELSGLHELIRHFSCRTFSTLYGLCCEGGFFAAGAV